MPCRKTVIGTAVPRVDVPKESDFWQWYRQTLDISELVDGSSTSPDCFVLRPAAYAIWERIRVFLDNRLRRMGVQNCAFPLSTLDTQATERRESLLADQPTTSSIISSHYARWINTHRDLPLRLSQWKPSVRPIPHPQPQPFFRSREVLVQEAHTAHLTSQDANRDIEQALDLYATVYEDLLAIPALKGWQINPTDTGISRAPESDAAEETTQAVVFAYIPDLDRCIDGAKCRALGQVLSREHGITVPAHPPLSSGEDTHPPIHAWQNSWEFSTRAVGIMLAMHGDNEGVVLPPRAAETQVVIVPCGSPIRDEEGWKSALARCSAIESALAALGVRAQVDERDGCSPGWKLHESRLRGAPLCILLGAEVSSRSGVVYRRDRPKSQSEVLLGDIPTAVPVLLRDIQESLFRNARAALESRQRQVTDWNELVCHLCERKDASICLAPHCLGKECERQIRALIAGFEDMEIGCLWVPWSQPALAVSGSAACINPRCLSGANKWAMFGSPEDIG